MVYLWDVEDYYAPIFFPQKTVLITATLRATVLLFLKSFCLFVCFCH